MKHIKVLVTGATGFLGFRTLEKLIDLPYISEIIATGRTLKETHTVHHPKVTYMLGDLSQYSFVEKIVTNVDYIVHTAALSSPWGAYKEFESANVTVQQNIIKASEQNDIKKIIYISTPSIYFTASDRFDIKESDPLPSRFINAYATTKRLAEISLENSNIPYIILRPRALVGRGDTVIMPRLIRASDENKLKIIGNGKNVVDFTSVANVVDAIILGFNASPAAMNQAYNITNGDPVCIWDKISLILTLLNKKAPNKKVSYTLAHFVAYLLELRSKLTTMKEPTLTVYSVGILAKSFTMDISKAKKLLGYTPKVTTDEAIHEFCEWYTSI
ncbi:NAD(P)-dependent oxidoreductase [Aquimarina addita]|uniref:NAD(P)-dependent oxidoreductase n=1 Tax=Aquimarina addita TaxID=870485 RepID=A0ABP6USV0_9FLAO